ncbi:hypothetical protein C8Q75DRAFT_889855 [Abortiporus biennis]|nr:hypothetical protein C8Q75DRAFT_889855 [Abortiporus biennis]
MDLPLNAIESLVIFAGDLGRGWNGPRLPLALHRSAPPEVAFQPEPSNFSSRQIPPAPQCLLPPPGKLSLHARLGTRLSQGRVGAVYDIECYIHKNDQGFCVPPLVMKIAKPRHAGDLAKEAANVPGDALCLENFDFGPVSVLLLEKLRERLPLGQGPDSFPPSLVQDLRDIASDFAELGIEHGDIRWNNILSAGTLPSLPSPFTKRTYGWRFIDFDLAVKTNKELEDVERGYQDYLDLIVNNIPFGCIVEPWE